MMTMAERLFLDTNILAYAARADTLQHAAALRLLNAAALQGDELWVSRQVLRELTCALLKPDEHGRQLTPGVVAQVVRDCARRYRVADEDRRTTSQLLRLVESHGLGARLVHDAHIVATMQVNKIGRLATNNVRDFLPFSGLIAIEPLVTV